MSTYTLSKPRPNWLSIFLRPFKNLGLHTTSPETLKSKYASEHSKYIKIDDTLIHYQDEGEGPVLVLTHGVMASLHTWDGWVEALKSKYRIIRFDIPGFGLSDPSAPGQSITPEYSVNLLNRFVDALDIKDFHLVGNSLGGFISWNYAAAYPERVNKLILIDPVGYKQKLPFIMKLVSTPGFQRIGRLAAPRFVVNACVRDVYGQPENIHKGVFDRYFDLLTHPGGRDAMVDLFLTFRHFNGHPDIIAKIKDITVPTLVMWGEEDAWIPVSHVENWKKDVPHAQTITYKDAGHVPMEEFSAQTSMDADQFLSIN
ncbi:MAG: alpha/beta hydrolase [Moraxellaceae bacterium]|nr:MAG: alpha/beta hydrolase [Moraxellaceae bacterium]